MKSFFKKAAVAFVLAAALCGQVKADLVSTMPEANATVTGWLPQITLTFSEGIVFELSKITVRGPKGRVRTTQITYQNDVLVAFVDTLALGKYRVDWRVVSSSKRKSHGTYTFTVRRLSSAPAVASAPVASAPVASAPVAAANAVEEAASGVVDLNTASANDLDARLGLGAKGAAAIIAGRPYASVDQLVSKGIVPQATFDKIKNHIVVTAVAAKSGGDEKKAPAATGPVDVNTATVDELDPLPLIGPTRAELIVAGRPYKSIDDLLAKGVVSQSTFDRIRGSIFVARHDSSGK